MKAKEIITIPAKILREKAKRVTSFDFELQQLSSQMVSIMRQYDGVGLAAPQIGESKRMIVLEYIPREKDTNSDKPFPLIVLINPIVTKFSSEKCTMPEGCLSLPGLEIDVTRPKEVNVSAQDISGKAIKVRAKGLLARVLQHEIDHLGGVLFTDHVKDIKNLKHYNNLRCVFMGTPAFAAPTLEALITNNLNVVGVITETDKPAGRNQAIASPVIKTIAQEFGLPVFQPETNSEIEEIVEKLDPDYIVVCAYGKILSEKVLGIPGYGAINIHPSLLPKYRGASPIQGAILAGEEKTGVTIMKMDEKMDMGGIIWQKEYALESDATTETLSSRLAIEGAKLLIKTLPLYLGNRVQPEPQDDVKATYTKIIRKEDGEINWNEPIGMIERKIRAYDPWPRAFVMLKIKDKKEKSKESGQRLIIHKAHLEDGKLVPGEVQLEGKKTTNWEDFKRGYKGNLPDKLR
ncbi:MAG: methionyl-tRNA formyltransferase [bacterium]|nr:methionyl-tRNA formyltransferase [bacterium]